MDGNDFRRRKQVDIRYVGGKIARESGSKFAGSVNGPDLIREKETLEGVAVF